MDQGGDGLPVAWWAHRRFEVRGARWRPGGDQAQPQLKCVAPISRPRWMAFIRAPSWRSM